MTPDVNVFLLNMPIGENEAVTENEDGSFSIFLNARLNYETQLKAYEHAMRHIINDDFQRDNVQEIEAIAHNVVKNAVPVVDADKIAMYEKIIRRNKRRRKKLQKQMEEYEREMQEIREMHDMFVACEHRYLYGNGLY